MINIEYQGATVSYIIRPRQISNLTQPYYTFNLYNKNSRTNIVMSADDISVAPGLYQEFYLRNGVNGLTAGNFIGDIGEYKITIYDTPYQYNLNIGSVSSTLMYDTMRVYGSVQPANVGYTASDTQTYTYYGQGN